MAKVEDLAAQYGWDAEAFEKWVKEESGFSFDTGFLGMGATSVSDGDVPALVEQYGAIYSQEQRERQEANEALSRILITSGFNFDGYRITKYSGYISGDDVVQIDRDNGALFFTSTTDVGAALSESLQSIRRNALRELKEHAYDMGCNAVIGVDFDYITLEPEATEYDGKTKYLPYVFCVTANGNAVTIEKTDD